MSLRLYRGPFSQSDWVLGHIPDICVRPPLPFLWFPSGGEALGELGDNIFCTYSHTDLASQMHANELLRFGFLALSLVLPTCRKLKRTRASLAHKGTQ